MTSSVSRHDFCCLKQPTVAGTLFVALLRTNSCNSSFFHRVFNSKRSVSPSINSHSARFSYALHLCRRVMSSDGMPSATPFLRRYLKKRCSTQGMSDIHGCEPDTFNCAVPAKNSSSRSPIVKFKSSRCLSALIIQRRFAFLSYLRLSPIILTFTLSSS